MCGKCDKGEMIYHGDYSGKKGQVIEFRIQDKKGTKGKILVECKNCTEGKVEVVTGKYYFESAVKDVMTLAKQQILRDVKIIKESE